MPRKRPKPLRGHRWRRDSAVTTYNSSTPPPLGDVIATIHHSDVESSGDQEDNTARITNSQYPTSYNWLSGDNPSIIFPGEPPQWTPPSDTPKLRQDNGQYYRDQNVGRYLAHPLESMIQAILTDKPDFPVTDMDVVGCEKTLGSLLILHVEKVKPSGCLSKYLARRSSSKGKTRPLRSIAALTGMNILSQRHTPLGVPGQLLEFEFAGMKCQVRFKADGFLPELVSETNGPHESPVLTEDLDPEKALSSIKGATISDSQSASAEMASRQLEIMRKGRHIPQCAIFDLKTRSHNKRSMDILGNEMSRLRFARSSEDGNFEIDHEQGEQSLNLRKQDGVVHDVLSLAVASNWDM